MIFGNSITDVNGIKVGHWTDELSMTGCTVVICPSGTIGGVDVRGAAPGTRETDLLKPENSVQEVNAILLSGGSAFGLAAASGVVDELAENKIGFKVGEHIIPIVPAAIIFDLNIGTASFPDYESGKEAVRSAQSDNVAVGSVGVGTGATAAKIAGVEHAIKCGIGMSSVVLDSGIIVSAMVVVNAFGCVRDADTGITVAGARGESGLFLDENVVVDSQNKYEESGSNTTLGIVVTNAKLDKTRVNRLATIAHDGFASSIWPVHTRSDGDVIFGLATQEIDTSLADVFKVEAFAVKAIERAILNAVSSSKSMGGIPSAWEWKQENRI